MRCRTKTGTLKLYYGGEHHLLDTAGMEVPNDVAESLRGHVNVIVGDKKPEPENAHETERKSGGRKRE